MAISFAGKKLDGTWLWELIRATLDDRAPGFSFTFGAQCGVAALRRVDQLEVDLRGLSDFVAVIQVIKGLDPRVVTGCIDRQTAGNKRLQLSNGVMTFAWSPDERPVVFGYTRPTTFIAAASPTDSLAAFGHALRRGLPLRRAPALAKLIGQVAPESVAWIAMTGGVHASAAQAALGVRPLSLVASASFAGSLTVTARMRFDSASSARKVAALVQPQLDKLAGSLEQLQVAVDAAEVVLRTVSSEAQTRALAEALGIRIPSSPR